VPFVRHVSLATVFSRLSSLPGSFTNLGHHFFLCKYSRKMKKGLVEFGANKEEGESESEVTNQMFGQLQHPN